MDRCSYFVKNRALFGSFPTQEAVYELENQGVRFFVNLTTNTENLIPYTTKYTYIHYPIVDHRIPYNWRSFSQFIIQISKIIFNLQSGEKLYLNCRGGHGRSGVVVACVLCYMFNITPEDALNRTTKYHNNRSVMRDKWRRIGSPQTQSQKNFVYKFFEPLIFYKIYKTGYTSGFSNFSLHQVNVPGLGVFPTSEAAYQAHKNPENSEYIEKQKNSRTPIFSKYIGSRCNKREDWDKIKNEIMEKVLRLKFEQNENIRNKLLSTGLRPLIEYNTKECNYSDDGLNEKDLNKLGKILTKIRNEFYEIYF